MSVPASKRSESNLEFLNQYNKIYNCIMYFIMKDFGIKNLVRDEYAYINEKHMIKEDKDQFVDLCNKYNIQYESQYPSWILEQYRLELFNVLHHMGHEITIANSIFPNSVYEFNLRKEHMHLAISDCEYLLMIFQRIINILPVNIEKYSTITEMIMKEIDLLRKWKKSINKYKNNLYESEEKAKIIAYNKTHKRCPIIFDTKDKIQVI